MRRSVRLPVAFDFFSPANRRRVTLWVWVPPGPGPFPCLVLLHGVNDSGSHGWWLKAKVHERAARLRGGSPPVIVMASDTNAERGTGYVDWLDGTARAETFVVEELLPWITAELPVTATRWATGLSMGGFGALLLALRHPGTFASVTATSGFFHPHRLTDYLPEAAGRIWPGEGEEYDVARLLLESAAAGGPGFRLAFDCGRSDVLAEDNRRLHQALAAAGVPHGFAEHDGGHDWPYWSARVEDHLRFHLGLAGPLGAAL